MKRITKIIFIVIVTSLVLGLVAFLVSITAYTNFKHNSVPSTSWPDEVDWTTAVEILNSEQVVEVLQYHNMEVTLTLEDGTQIKTVEPSIDEIFREIEQCGNVCSEILLITE